VKIITRISLDITFPLERTKRYLITSTLFRPYFDFISQHAPFAPPMYRSVSNTYICLFAVDLVLECIHSARSRSFFTDSSPVAVGAGEMRLRASSSSSSLSAPLRVSSLSSRSFPSPFLPRLTRQTAAFLLIPFPGLLEIIARG